MPRKRTNAAAASNQVAAASISTDNGKQAIVVAAYPGTEELMERVWKKFLNDSPFMVVTQNTDDLMTALVKLTDNAHIDDDFVLIPSNTFPTAPISRRELYTPMVCVDKAGKQHFDHRLPHHFTKAFIREYIDGHSFPTADELCKLQLEAFGPRPVEAAFAFGNYICPVLRGNPCEHLVLEAFLRKKYVACSKEGFKAIEDLVEKLAAS